jgi:hypothetical protein
VKNYEQGKFTEEPVEMTLLCQSLPDEPRTKHVIAKGKRVKCSSNESILVSCDLRFFSFESFIKECGFFFDVVMLSPPWRLKHQPDHDRAMSNQEIMGLRIDLVC